ncbi:MAG TPA: hypothetical protein VNQ77_03855 [Frankiaceae bacterium]|nr:hypothetical protein [Frankiaceae bacterium]
MPLRRRTLVALAAVALATPTANAAVVPGIGAFSSANVTWHGTLPVDVPGIGADVVTVGGQRRFYVTGARGLSIYDVTDPALPIPLGHLELPHFENEAVAVARDGSVAIIASEAGLTTYVVDTTNPAVPTLASVIAEGTHTAACSDAECSYLYASFGWAYDLRDRANPKKVADWGGEGYGFTHAANLDDAGYVIADWSLKMYDPRTDPASPTLVAEMGDISGQQVSLGHNNQRPDADLWQPRAAGDTSPGLRPGELLLTGGETLSTGSCPGGSGITSWSIANFDRGATFTPLDTFYPSAGNYVDGNPAVNALGCSSHWFDYRDGVVAAGWYENGVRFFDVHRTTGDITEVGWYQPVATEAWAAYWIDDEYVYSVDAVRGIDILRFDRDAAPPAQSQSDASWRLDPNRPLSFVSRRERLLCSQAQRRA